MELIEEICRFKSYARRPGVPTDTLVVHESVTPSMDRTLVVLQRKGCGVHFLIDRDGTVYKLMSVERYVAHAGKLNRRSVGIEVVNPYYPTGIPKSWTERPQVISGKWAHRGQYAVPPDAQLSALWDLVKHLVDIMDDVSADWVGLLDGNRFAMARVSGAKKRSGIHAHTYTHHADGGFPVLYCYLRSLGWDHAGALDKALDMASGAGRVLKLSDDLYV
jgi:hypothetical protein